MTDYINVKSSIKKDLEGIFGIDLRSLALFRISLALLVLGDLVWRVSDIKAFYTDFGVLPRSVLLDKFISPLHFSIHLISGSYTSQVILFLINALFALFLLVGYRARLMSLLCWFFFTSLQVRNPAIHAGGDDVLRLVLFWSMFVPLGACYSIDSALNSSNEKLPKRVFSTGTLALLIQILLVYVVAWGCKTAPEWKEEGTAIYYALSLERFAFPFGQWLLHFPVFLKYITHSIWWFELIGPLFLLVPHTLGLIRIYAILAFVLLNLGFGLCLTVGIFPFVNCIALTPFLPSLFWDRIISKLKPISDFNLTIYYDGDCNFCKKSVLLLKTFLLIPEIKIFKAQEDESIFSDMKTQNSWVIVDSTGTRHYKYDAFKIICNASPLRPILRFLPLFILSDSGKSLYEIIASNRTFASGLTSYLAFRPVKVQQSKIGSIFVVFLLVYICLWQYPTFNPKYKFPDDWKLLGFVTHIGQGWSMFAPAPSKVDGWYVVPAKLRNGTEFDLFKGPGSTITWEKPKSIIKMYKNNRWLKFIEALQGDHSDVRFLNYGGYFCRSWNTTHKDPQYQLVSFEFYWMGEENLPNYKPSETKKILMWKHLCFEPEKPK